MVIYALNKNKKRNPSVELQETAVFCNDSGFYWDLLLHLVICWTFRSKTVTKSGRKYSVQKMYIIFKSNYLENLLNRIEEFKCRTS